MTPVYGVVCFAAAALFLTNFILKQILYRSKKISELVQGDPVMLILNGKILEQNLKKERISLEELEASVREHGVSSAKDVNLAVLETDGNISILSENYQRHTQKKKSTQST